MLSEGVMDTYVHSQANPRDFFTRISFFVDIHMVFGVGATLQHPPAQAWIQTYVYFRALVRGWTRYIRSGVSYIYRYTINSTRRHVNKKPFKNRGQHIQKVEGIGGQINDKQSNRKIHNIRR